MGARVKRAAVVALSVLVATSLGCGKMETSHRMAKAGSSDESEKSAALPSDFPKDVPILKGASLRAVLSQGGHTVLHLYTTSSVAEAAKFYDEELKRGGWTIASSQNTGDIYTVSAKKGKTLCGVTVSKEGKRTLVRLAVAESS
jgi:hypothetical protein